MRSSVIKHFSVIDKALSSISSHCKKEGEKGVATNQGRAQSQEHLHRGYSIIGRLAYLPRISPVWFAHFYQT